VYAAPFFDRHRGPGPFRVLDVGTGGGDIAIGFARWARRRGRRVEVLALDLDPEVLACAAEVTRPFPEVRLVAADALEPPLRPGTVDLAVCSLMLHHLSEEGVVHLLRRLAGVARLGFVVSDLRRGRLAWATAWVLTRAISRNRLTRHDGPLSVRRAYTRAELRGLSAQAGLPDVDWRRAPAFRVVGIHHGPGSRSAKRDSPGAP
jgi:SAM-dependent methyltransferase